MATNSYVSSTLYLAFWKTSLTHFPAGTGGLCAPASTLPFRAILSQFPISLFHTLRPLSISSLPPSLAPSELDRLISDANFANILLRELA